MPTAMPIIEARIVAEESTSMNAVMAVTPVSPIATPMMALKIGMPAATRDPKVSTSTISATPRPIASEVRPSSEMRVAPGPLASTSRPESRASAMTSSSASRLLPSMSVGESTSHSKLMMPVRPSSLRGEIASAFALASRTAARSPPAA